MIELRRRYSGGVQSPSFSRLPKGYQEVEYLDNSENPNAYLVIPEIVRGYAGSIIADILISSISTQQPAGRYKFAFGWSQGPQVVLDTMQWQNYYVGPYIADVGVKYKVQLDINDYISALFIDGNLIAKNTVFDNDRGLHILNSHASNLGLFGRIYNLKSDGTVTIDLIPCYRISDRVAGMYDIVNDVFYTNAGTGEFSVGMDIVYDSLPTFDYMLFYEAGGCFDTGYIPNERTSIEMEFALTEKINDILIAGCVGASPWDLRFGIWTFQQGVQAAKTSTSSAYTLVHFSKFLETDKLKVVVKNSISYIYINDILYDQVGYYTEQKFNSFRTIYIGAMNNGASAAGLFVGKMYSFKIRENENLIHDYRAYEDNKIIDIKTGEIVENIGQKPAYAREELMNNDIIG